MSAVHLIRTYCLSTMLYGCEVWSLTDISSMINMVSLIFIATRHCTTLKTPHCRDFGVTGMFHDVVQLHT